MYNDHLSDENDMLREQVATLQQEVERLTRERDEARSANERDRTEIIVAVNALSDAFARRDWLIRGGRGSYEWDDDRFRDEFRDAMAEFEPHVDRLRKIGADRTNCPETWAEVLAARAEASAAVKVERDVIAKIVYEAMVWSSQLPGDPGEPIPSWVSGGNSFAQDHARAAECRILSALSPADEPAPQEAPHPDDAAVDRFASAMKSKLKWEREERGRGGWDDPAECSEEYLARLLVEHLTKGNEGTFEDVANFAMMLHQRGADPTVLAKAAAPQEGEAVAWEIAYGDGSHCLAFTEDEADDAIAESASGATKRPLFAHPPAAQAVTEAWQPIETAPKGQEVLIAYWRWRNSMAPGSIVVQSARLTEFHGGGIWSWVVSDNKHGPYPIRGWSDGDMLGWMPLPAAPALSAREGSR